MAYPPKTMDMDTKRKGKWKERWLGPRKHVHGCKMKGKIDLLLKNKSIAIKRKELMTPIESPWNVEKMASLKKNHMLMDVKKKKDG